MRIGAECADAAKCRECWVADVPFGVIGVPFRRGQAASSASSVSFSFIHTNDMPVFRAFRFPLCRLMR
jgi:uncharacterized protein YbaA (DUF1428 family)